MSIDGASITIGVCLVSLLRDPCPISRTTLIEARAKWSI